MAIPSNGARSKCFAAGICRYPEFARGVLLVFNIDVSKPQQPIESLSQGARGVALLKHDFNVLNDFALAFNGLSLISIDFHRFPIDLFIAVQPNNLCFLQPFCVFFIDFQMFPDVFQSNLLRAFSKAFSTFIYMSQRILHALWPRYCTLS